MNKKISLIFIIIITFCAIFNANTIKADSGWDASYDSGSSSSSYSSGGSSYDNDYSSSSSSSGTERDYSIIKIVYDDRIEIEEARKKIIIYKSAYEELYDELKGTKSYIQICKEVYNDRVIIKEKNNSKEIVIYKSQYNSLYEELRGNYIPPKKSMFLFDDRIEIAENGETTIVYKAENEELYNELKKEIEAAKKRKMIFGFVFLGIILTLNLAIPIFIIIKFRKRHSHNYIIEPKIERKEIDDEILIKYGLNKEEIIKKLYDSYVKVQIAWMNFDYDTLKEELTNELYNTYISQLEALKLKEEQNIMDSFEFVEGKIYGINEKDGQINSIDVYLKVRMHDYVVNKNMEVVRGTKNFLIEIGYIITLVCENKFENDDICPNCGSKLEFTSEGECSYCRTKIIRPVSKYVISQKKAVDQRRR